MSGFALACNFINTTIDPKLVNNVRIQTLVYSRSWSQFDLSANLTIRAIARVSSNRKTAKLKNKPVKDFRPTRATESPRLLCVG